MYLLSNKRGELRKRVAYCMHQYELDYVSAVWKLREREEYLSNIKRKINFKTIAKYIWR